MDFNGFRTDFNGFCLLFFLHCPLLAGWAVVLWGWLMSSSIQRALEDIRTLSPSLGIRRIWSFPKSWGYPQFHFNGMFPQKNHPFWVFPIVRKLDQLDGSNANWIQLDSAWTLPTVVDPALVVARSSGTDSCPMVIFTETLKYSTASNFNWHGWSKFYDIPCKLQRESFRISQNYGDAEVWTSFPFQSNGCLCWTRRYDGLKTSNGTSNDFNQ